MKKKYNTLSLKRFSWLVEISLFFCNWFYDFWTFGIALADAIIISIWTKCLVFYEAWHLLFPFFVTAFWISLVFL